MGATVNAPIILDLGKTSRKRIRQLKEGRGRLVGDVQDALAEATATLGPQADGQQLLPVVLVYRRKSKKRNRGGILPFVL